MEEGRKDASAAAAQGMADGDRAAPGVDLGGIETAFADHRDALGGEGLIQFDGVQLVHRQPQASQNLPGGRYRADAHAVGLHPSHGAAQDAGPGLQPRGLGGLLFHDEKKGRAIGEGRAVTRRDASILQEGGFQFAKFFKGGVGPDAFITLHLHFLPLQIFRGVGHTFFGVLARRPSRGALLMAIEGELVLLAARDAIFLHEVFGGDAHGAVGLGIVLGKPGIKARIEASHRHFGHGLDAAREEDIPGSSENGASRHEHRLLARATEAIHRRGPCCDGETRPESHQAGQVHALLSLGHRAAHQDILQGAPVLQQRLDGLDHHGAHGFRASGGGGPFDRPAHGRSLRFNDDGRSHGWLLDGTSLAPGPNGFHRLPAVGWIFLLEPLP